MIPKLEALKRELGGHIARRTYFGHVASKKERQLSARIDVLKRIDMVCNALKSLVDHCSSGYYYHVSMKDGIHELVVSGESMGCLISLHEITDKLPKFIDGVPDYLYNPEVAAMSYNFKGKWTAPTIEVAERILQYGSSDNIWFPALLVRHQHIKPLDYPPMNQGIIPLDEVMDGLKKDGWI